MRILVIGSAGQVATSLAAQARHWTGVDLMALGRPALDLEDLSAAKAAIIAAAPDLIVNAAAYTAVDKAETDRARAFAVNRDGARVAAEAAVSLNVPFIHLSTDYVFDGSKASPYVETDQTAPLNVYGRSKREGEEAVLAAHPAALIIRTSWVFSQFGANFLKTMLRLGAERQNLRIVSDQIGNPTSATDIADAILSVAPQVMSSRELGGIYHLTNAGSTNWFDFAGAIFAESDRLGGPAPSLEPITTVEYPTPARRPFNSRLDTSAFEHRFDYALRPWQEAVAETVHDLIGAVS